MSGAVRASDDEAGAGDRRGSGRRDRARIDGRDHPSSGGLVPERYPLTSRPPEVLEPGPIELHRHCSADCAQLVDAVNESLGELRRWMPWAQTAATEASIGDFLERSRRAWDEGLEFGYSIRPAAPSGTGDAIIGSCGLHFRSDPGVAEIGYWVRTDRTGAGIATAAARTLTSAALELAEVAHVEIHCDAANRASRAVPAKLGYRLDRVEMRPPTPRTPEETDELMIWVFPA